MDLAKSAEEDSRDNGLGRIGRGLMFRGGRRGYGLCRTSDGDIAGSTPGRSTARWQPWPSCSHTCASVNV